MKHIYVFCEGRTEQGFCKQVLHPHLFPAGDGQVHTLAVGEKSHRHVYGMGRGRNYQRVRKSILDAIKQHPGNDVYFTTLFDLYALPTDFPGAEAKVDDRFRPEPYVVALEQALAADINHYRFIPYLQRHEYETILFADPNAFRVSFENCESGIAKLKEVAAGVACIEDINEGRMSAPSKRIIAEIPEYEGRKASAGPRIAEEIGMGAIRAKCPHFAQWISQLENLKWDNT